MASVVVLSRSAHGVCGGIIKVGSWRLWGYYQGQVMASVVVLSRLGHDVCGSIIKVGSWRLW